MKAATLYMDSAVSPNWMLSIKDGTSETVVDTMIPYVKPIRSEDIAGVCHMYDCELMLSPHPTCEPVPLKAPPPDTVAMVAEFHRAFDYEIPNAPRVTDLDNFSKLALLAICGRLRDALGTVQHMLRQHHGSPQCLQRPALILEELLELCEAMSRNDTLGCLDACEDLEYVVSGTIVALGLASIHHEAFRRVHASNMSKLKDGKVVKDENGKVVKGDWYKPVDLSDLLG